MRRNCMSKAHRFLQITAKTSRFSFVYRIFNDKNFIPKYLDNVLTDSVLTSRTSRRLLEEKVPKNDFTVRNNAASIIGNGVISLLWQLRCHCNPNYGKFSSLSNTTVVAIFPNICLWRRSLCSNLAGIDPEKLYWGTFMCQYGLCCCIVWPSFLFDCFVKIWATCKNFLGKWVTAPPGRKLPVRLWLNVHTNNPKDNAFLWETLFSHWLKKTRLSHAF